MRGRRFHITFSPSDSARIWMEHRTFFKCTGPWSCPTGKLLCSANVLLWPAVPSPQDWRVLSPVDHVARQFKGGKVWDNPHAWRHCPRDWQQYPGTQMRLLLFTEKTNHVSGAYILPPNRDFMGVQVWALLCRVQSETSDVWGFIWISEHHDSRQHTLVKSKK